MIGFLFGIVLLGVAAPEPTPVESVDVRTMTLAEASQILRKRNPDLETAEAAIDEARAVAHQSLAAVKPVVVLSGSYVRNNTDAVVDMRRLFDGLEQELARRRLRMSEQEVRVANAAAESAARSFVEGTTSSLDVLDAQDEAFQAELRYEEARLRSSAAAADLRAAQGLP